MPIQMPNLGKIKPDSRYRDEAVHQVKLRAQLFTERLHTEPLGGAMPGRQVESRAHAWWCGCSISRHR